MGVPTEVLHAATGVPEANIKELKQYKLVIAPGTGGEDCLRKCGKSFDLVSLTNSSSAPPGSVQTSCHVDETSKVPWKAFSCIK